MHARLVKACECCTESYELILVNDGSSDSTWSLLESLHSHDPHTVAINLSRNFGQECAIHAGLCHSRGKYTLIIDADLQDPPELLAQMLESMTQGADVVYGVRKSRNGESVFKMATASMFYWTLERFANVPIPRNTGNFRLLRRCVVDSMLSLPEQPRFLRGLTSWVGYRQVPIYFDREARFAGTSKWPTSRMLRLATAALYSYTDFPIKALAAIAMAPWLVAIAAYMLMSLGLPVAAVATFASAGLFSLMLIALTIIGIYQAKILGEARHRPAYIIANLLGPKTLISHPIDATAAAPAAKANCESFSTNG